MNTCVVDEKASLCLTIERPVRLLPYTRRLAMLFRRGTADARAAANGVVVYQILVLRVLNGIQLVCLVFSYLLLPYRYLVDVEIQVIIYLLISAVHYAVARHVVGGRLHLIAPPWVSIGASPLGVTLVVLGVVHHLAGHLGTVGIVPVVAIDVRQHIIDEGLPVGDEGMQDVILRIDEIGTKRLTDGDGVLLVYLVSAVTLLEDAHHTTLAELHVGCTADVGISVVLHGQYVGRGFDLL